MRLPGFSAVALLLALSASASAQAPEPAPGTHASRHACLNARLAGLHQAMADHMAKYRAENPKAAHWEVKLERHSFSERSKADHRSEIDAARTACGLKNHHHA